VSGGLADGRKFHREWLRAGTGVVRDRIFGRSDLRVDSGDGWEWVVHIDVHGFECGKGCRGGRVHTWTHGGLN